MKIQFISDIHLESVLKKKHPILFYEKILTPVAPILILAGDIGTFERDGELVNFLEWTSTRWDHVVYVIGNHEYYRNPNLVTCSPRERTKFDRPSKTADRRLASETNLSLDLFKFKKKTKHLTNLTILDRGIVEIEGIWIAGTTLWSAIDTRRKVMPWYIKRRLNITPEEYRARFERDKKWILRVHREAQKLGRKVCCVTHHCPRNHFLPRNKWTIKNKDLYASALDLRGSPEGGIQWWIFGHTHFNVNTVHNGIHYITNQHGKEKDVDCQSKQNMYINICVEKMLFKKKMLQ